MEISTKIVRNSITTQNLNFGNHLCCISYNRLDTEESPVNGQLSAAVLIAILIVTDNYAKDSEPG